MQSYSLFVHLLQGFMQACFVTTLWLGLAGCELLVPAQDVVIILPA